MLGSHTTLKESVSDSVVRNMHTNSMEVILYGSGSALPVSPSRKQPILVLLPGYCSSMALTLLTLFNSPSPGIYPICSWNCAERQIKPPYEGMNRCNIKEELFSLIELQVMPHVATRTQTKHKMRQNQSERIRREQLIVTATILFLKVLLLSLYYHTVLRE